MTATLTNPALASPTMDALREEWNELLQDSDSDCLFLTWEWLSTWWNHLAGDGQLAIMNVRSEDRLDGLAPLTLRKPGVLQRSMLPRMEFLGTGSVGSDYLDLIVRRGREMETVREFVSLLTGRRSVLRCAQLRTSSFASRLSDELSRDGWTVAEATTNICPFISLAGLSWESYMAGLGSEHRYAFHRKWRRLNREFDVRFEEVRTEEECRQSIDLVIALHNMRWQHRGGSDAFHTPQLVAFHREFSLLALRQGWLRLYVLRVNGHPAACIYGFLYRGKFYFYQSGFDPAFDRHSVGLVAMGLAIQNAIAEGAGEFDLLHGNETYKSHWSKESRELVRLELYPPGRLGVVCRSSVEFERASRRFARRALAGKLFS